MCRKNFPALNVQATCDARGLFTSVDCSWSGSVHDARIWRNSPIQQVLSNNPIGALLLADEAYPLTPWVMKIYKNPQTEAEKKFNLLLKKERTLIERTFGQLKQRFPILYSKIRVSIERIPPLITACFVLHNVAKYLNDPEFEVIEEDNISTDNHDNAIDGNLNRRGAIRRNRIANLIEEI